MIYNVGFYTQNLFSYLSPITIEYQKNNTLNQTVSYQCKFMYYDILSWSDLINSTIMPFAIMIIFTGIILKFLSQKRSRFAMRRDANIVRDRKFAFTIIIMNISFLILNIPLCVYNLCDAYLEMDPKVNALFKNIGMVLFFSNFACLFCSNLIVNSIFRKEVIRLLRLKKG